MNTKIKNIAVAMDNAIEDVNKDYATKAITNIGSDLLHATVAMGASYMYMGSAIVSAAELAGRSAKTGVKKAVITMNEYFENSPAMTVYR